MSPSWMPNWSSRYSAKSYPSTSSATMFSSFNIASRASWSRALTSPSSTRLRASSGAAAANSASQQSTTRPESAQIGPIASTCPTMSHGAGVVARRRSAASFGVIAFSFRYGVEVWGNGRKSCLHHLAFPAFELLEVLLARRYSR